MQKLIIVGNLVGDPQSRVTQAGKNVCTFTVAVNRRHKKDETDFFRVSVWDRLGELCQQYLAKGRKVAVTGSVSVSTYSAQNGEVRGSLNVTADEVEFLTPKAQEQTKGGFAEVSSDDLPWGN
jgi:single-strand DNA-binding protein